MPFESASLLSRTFFKVGEIDENEYLTTNYVYTHTASCTQKNATYTRKGVLVALIKFASGYIYIFPRADQYVTRHHSRYFEMCSSLSSPVFPPQFTKKFAPLLLGSKPCSSTYPLDNHPGIAKTFAWHSGPFSVGDLCIAILVRLPI